MTREQVDTAVAAIRARHKGPFPEVAIILGSGLGQFGDDMAVETVIAYEEIAGFPVSTVAGHAGRLLIGRLGPTPLVAMQGRMHLYEGYPATLLALPIRAFRELGVKILIITNAAGSLREDMGPASLMIIDDHINFSGQNPLTGVNDDHFGPRFFDMTEAYDAGLRAALADAAAATGVTLHRGVYIQAAGPNFETPAEVRAFARWGADAVGMSTVPECLVARHCGLRVVGLSVITNLAAGLAGQELTHTETMEEADKASADLRRLLGAFIAGL